jgi:sugar lactone lactonase YvrE
MRREPDGDLVSVVGGGSFVNMGTDPGPAVRVALQLPQGVWLDSDGSVFFSDDDNRIIRHFDPASGLVTNFAVTPKKFHSFGLYLYFAGALVSDERYFYLSDPNFPGVWRISRTDRSVDLYVSPAHLKAPAGLALDSRHNLYVADGLLGESEGRILRVDAADHSVATIWSALHQPSGLALQSADTLCLSESGANQIACIDLKRHTFRTVAGTGVGGFSGDGGPAECAQLNRPSGISFDGRGNLYIADTGNQRIRRVNMGTTLVRCAP